MKYNIKDHGIQSVGGFVNYSRAHGKVTKRNKVKELTLNVLMGIGFVAVASISMFF